MFQILGIQLIITIINFINLTFKKMLRTVSRIYRFAQQKFLTPEAYLKIRNSENFQVVIPILQKQQVVSIRVPKTGTLADLTKQLQTKLQLTGVRYYCNEKIIMPESTLLDVLINRYFYVNSNEYRVFPVEGQLFDYGKSDEVVEGIVGLELPAVSKRQIQSYFTRVNQWVQFHSGKNILDQTVKLDAKTVGQIFVDAAIDPQPQERRILDVQAQWQRVYWQVNDLKKKKKQADEQCLKQVRRKMSWGLVVLGGNIAFVWSGTYVFYSWDIMEPLAYFVSSMGAIILAAQFFKLGRMYSNAAYQQYLMEKVSPQIYKQKGFSVEQLAKAENNLIQLESTLKDFYLKRL